MPGLSFQKNVQQDSSEAGTQPQVQTDGQQTSQSAPSPELTSEENKTPDADKVSDASGSFHGQCCNMWSLMISLNLQFQEQAPSCLT